MDSCIDPLRLSHGDGVRAGKLWFAAPPRVDATIPKFIVTMIDANHSAGRSFVGLMYHNVCRPDGCWSELSPSITSYFLDQQRFEEQLQEVVAQGGWFMGADSLASFYGLAGNITKPPSARFPVLLTFDDGWEGSVETAGPVLEAHGCEAFLFVTTDFVGLRHFLSRPQLGRLPRERFRVGSHGRTHRMLSLLSAEQVRAELADSKAYLEDAIGDAVDAVSIPSGAINAQVRKIAAEVGYRYIFTSEPQVNYRAYGPLAIGRVAIKRNTSLETFRAYVRQRLLGARFRRILLGLPKRCLGLARYERLRRMLLRERSDQYVTHES